MRLMIALLAGGLFGTGLLVSGMTDTRKVQGWLDFFGNWDPTLAFVLGGAILPMVLAWRLTRGRTPLTSDAFPAPAPAQIDGHLALGSVSFGMGWALVGLCPGPALAVLLWGGAPVWLFFVAMVGGMIAAHAVTRGPLARRMAQ
ncbi:DUF6691 family protein [Primorskyibacter sp. S187A]|uniref:DUF6691 family protein n=1 Tax=Primorskyibacter sp. S187A TaxID=3415130 RepID=UPI003C7D991C